LKLPRHLFLVGLVCVWSSGLIAARDYAGMAVPAPASAAAFTASTWSAPAIGTLDRRIFELALRAASCAVSARAVAPPATLAVIDYSKPSTAKRLWVFDLRTHALLYEELVAHGQGTGDDLARVFSNEPDSHRSSLGLFATDQTYVGKNGYSLRLDGLERGINDRARERAIVMHGAPYVSEAFIKAQGRLGRSFGCPAIRQGVAREVLDRIRGNGLLFAYYPDPSWLRSSKFLNTCTQT